ncbi:MAG: cysteine--tRNA ligase [Candidatus Woesearchaeota archaeon]
MELRLHNTLGNKIEPFVPIKKGIVSMYSCGPTVYWYQHIGNLRSYIFSDILRRVLLYNGFNVLHVMNITDVGHLTSDADEGEDKIEKAAQKEGKKAEEIAQHYWTVFKDDCSKLNIIEPSVWCKATQHIKEQIALIQKLEAKGYTYRTDDGIYFDTSKFKDYGKLARLKIEGLEAGKRVDLKDKKNITDFALWKFSEEPGKRQQEWPSPWGIGFPGWHIECSAMSMRYLGETFDIHTGGIDHIPVHHTNEIAQSEAATGKKFVNYWLHGAFLTFKGEKVSKSKGGLYTISELEALGFQPLDYRYFAFTAHYRMPLEFSIENLQNAKNSYTRLKNIVAELTDDKELNREYLSEFEKEINEDLNMPNAMAVLWRLLRDPDAKGKLNAVREMDKVFGLDLLRKEEVTMPDDVKDLVEQREKVRKNKDFAAADRIREEIKKKGFLLDDTKDGVRLKKI